MNRNSHCMKHKYVPIDIPEDSCKRHNLVKMDIHLKEEKNLKMVYFKEWLAICMKMITDGLSLTVLLF